MMPTRNEDLANALERLAASFADSDATSTEQDELLLQAARRLRAAAAVLKAWERLGDDPEVTAHFDREALPCFFWTAIERLQAESAPRSHGDGLRDMLDALTSTGAELLADAIEEAAEIRPDLFDGLDRTVV